MYIIQPFSYLRNFFLGSALYSLYAKNVPFTLVASEYPTGLQIQTIAGGNYWCASCATGDGGPGTSAAMDKPYQTWIDSNEQYMYITTYQNVKRLDISTYIITAFAGLSASATSSGDSGPATSAALYTPVGVWGNSIGEIFVSESQGKVVRVIDIADNIINTYAGTLSTSSNTLADGDNGDGGQATAAVFYGYLGFLAGDTASNLYVADFETHVVRRIDYATGIITTYAGIAGDSTSTDGATATSGTMNAPYGLFLRTSNNNLYVGEFYGRKVRMVSTTAGLTTVAGTGNSGTSPSVGVQALLANLSNVGGVWVAETTGNVYFAATMTYGYVGVVEASSGDVFNVAGWGLSTAASAVALEARLYSAVAITGLSEERLFVSDRSTNSRSVRQIVPFLPSTPPTLVPTIQPSQPTLAPSGAPSVSPTEAPSNPPKTGGNGGGGGVDVTIIIGGAIGVVAMLCLAACAYCYKKKHTGKTEEAHMDSNGADDGSTTEGKKPSSVFSSSSSSTAQYTALPKDDKPVSSVSTASYKQENDIEMGHVISSADPSLSSSSSSSSSSSDVTANEVSPPPPPTSCEDVPVATVPSSHEAEQGTTPTAGSNVGTDTSSTCSRGGTASVSFDLERDIAMAAEDKYSAAEVAGMLSGVADGLLGIAADHVPIIGAGASLLRQLIDICSAPMCAQEAFEQFHDRMEAMYGLLYKPQGIMSKVDAGPRGVEILKPFALRFENIIQDGITSMGRFTKKGFFARLLSGHGPEEEFADLDKNITSCVNDLTTALSLQQLTQQAQTYEALVDVKALIERQGGWGGVANMEVNSEQLKTLAKELGVVDAAVMREEAQEYLMRIEEGVNKVSVDVNDVKQGVDHIAKNLSNVDINLSDMATNIQALTKLILELRQENVMKSGVTDTESTMGSRGSDGGRDERSSRPPPIKQDVWSEWLLTETPTVDLSSCLGEGSFGSVYAGRYKARDVAIKLLNKAVLDGSNLSMLRREVRLHLKVSRLPGVVAIIAVAINPDQYFDKPCIIMERGLCSLHDAIHKPKEIADLLLDGNLTLTAKLLLLLQLASALECVAAAQMIHRDIKPANVLLFESAFGLHAKLCDFGLSKSTSGSSIGQSSATAGVKGTPAYLSPESYEKHYSTASDVYAYTVLFNETLSGEIPFGNEFTAVELIYAVCVKRTRPAMYATSREGATAVATAKVDGLATLTTDIQAFIEQGWAHSAEDRWTFSHATVDVKIFLDRALALMKKQRSPAS